jgi:hypothetical protein
VSLSFRVTLSVPVPNMIYIIFNKYVFLFLISMYFCVKKKTLRLVAPLALAHSPFVCVVRVCVCMCVCVCVCARARARRRLENTLIRGGVDDVCVSSIDMYNNDVGKESAQKFMKQTGDLKAATLYFAS